jgi:hypothetical protein
MVRADKIFFTKANLPERIRMFITTPNVPSLQANSKSEDSFLDLNEYLLPANPDTALLVKIDEDSEDFNSGDLLVVDISKKPEAEEFVLVEDGEARLIEKYNGSNNVFGVVTSVIRKL